MDLYESLMGEAPTDQQRAAEIAAALRRRSKYGELGMLTGDRVLSKFGEGQVKRADDYAQQFQDTRQKDIDNAQTKSYQDAQVGHMGASLKQALAIAQMNDATQRRGQDMSLLAALERAKTAKEPKIGKLTYADRNKLENIANTRNGAQALADSFEDSYSQQMAPGMVPEMGQSRLSNTLASMGMGTNNMKAASNWWAQWNLIYTLPQRNATFGATLTPGEKQAWFESDINQSMEPGEIRKRVQNVINILNNKAALADKTYRAQGFDPEAINAYGLTETQPDATAGADNALTPAEEAELAELRKRYPNGSAAGTAGSP